MNEITPPEGEPLLQKIIATLGGRRTTNGAQCRCPCHNDTTASLSVKVVKSDTGSTKIVFNCFAHCDPAAIIGAFKQLGLWPTRDKTQQTRRHSRELVNTYHYEDETGEVLFKVCRYAPKRFLPFRPEPGKAREWVPGLDGVRRIPYHLPALLEAVSQGKLVCVVEGEKDVESLARLGVAATTSPSGAGAWRPDYARYFVGADVLVLPDNDAAGRSYAQTVCRSLQGTANRVRVLELPELPDKGDVTDWLAAGGDTTSLLQLAEGFAMRGEDYVCKKEPALSLEIGRESALALTDSGNATRLIRLHGQSLRFCYEWNTWVCWNGSFWEKSKDRPVELAKDVARALYAEAGGERDPDRRRDLVNWGRQSESQYRIKAMLELARSIPGVPVKVDDFDRNRYLFNCANGTIDLKKGELRSHSPSDLITKCAPVQYPTEPGIPVFLDCPQWLCFLDQIFEKDQLVVDYFQRAVGYTLSGDVSERILFVGHGGGRNGKSTANSIIAELLGPYAMRLPMQSLLKKRSDSIPNDLAALRGVRFAYSSEVEQHKQLSESLVKDLTGNELISARFLYGEYFTFMPTFKIWLTTNHKPNITGTDDAIWDRIRLIPFTYRIPAEKVNTHLTEELREELPGILRWAVEGAASWSRSGLGTCPRVAAAGEEYRNEMDSLKQFLHECCIVNECLSTRASSLYDQYVEWSGDRSVSKRRFSGMLKERGFNPPERRGAGGYHWWRGIGLLSGGDSASAD